MDRSIVTVPPEVEAWFTVVPRPATEAALRRVTRAASELTDAQAAR